MCVLCVGRCYGTAPLLKWGDERFSWGGRMKWKERRCRGSFHQVDVEQVNFQKLEFPVQRKGEREEGVVGEGMDDTIYNTWIFSFLFCFSCFTVLLAEGLAINYTSSAIRRFGIRKGRKRKTNDAGKETRGREDDRGPHEPDLLSGNAAPDD